MLRMIPGWYFSLLVGRGRWARLSPPGWKVVLAEHESECGSGLLPRWMHSEVALVSGSTH